MFNFIAKLSPAFSPLLFFLPFLACNKFDKHQFTKSKFQLKTQTKMETQCAMCVCEVGGGVCVCVSHVACNWTENESAACEYFSCLSV